MGVITVYLQSRDLAFLEKYLLENFPEFSEEQENYVCSSIIISVLLSTANSRYFLYVHVHVHIIYNIKTKQSTKSIRYF